MAEAKDQRTSRIFQVSECPVPNPAANHHEGLDALLTLMGRNGLRFYKTEKSGDLNSVDGLIGARDVVLMKVNAQWKYRGCTSSDVARGLVQRVLEHPDGFEGEVVLIENGQGGGSFECATEWGGQYPDSGVHANAEDERQSFTYLVEDVFDDARVSQYLMDPLNTRFIHDDDHSTDGYRRLPTVSYPCFTTRKGNRVELAKGVWNGKNYDDNLKLITVPVLKHHMGCGITGALKIHYGILSMLDGGRRERHYEKLGDHCATMITKVRTPVLNILDCTWVSPGSLAGYPAKATTRLDKLLASQDPIALDYWASKHLLYPLDHNEEHNPDGSSALHRHLKEARAIINAGGGVFGRKVTMNEGEIEVLEELACPTP